jgi:hypothetical protein
MTKTVRSPFNHEVGGKVEGCTILEKRVVIPPNPDEKRRGIYDYVVEVPPTPAGVSGAKAAKTRTPKPAPAPKEGSAGFTRATPEEVGGVIRRIGSR